ncbi:TetR family transcriptional regulator [Murinocardiopsis flavida]|uniref:TetR family transcriptional regulator n=1 Tax=Murinocardiopsis flavida TaxID=645275 RepID=A0A2P8DMU6_9ACTN|nr:TetR/AcrR family transcriptional regulator [Murinocardiopsis flavida]PSK98538.1 TetR family transcriptional regulator [Murinocardiopsis flavida]
MTTRDRILDAAAQVMRERGLARATTKEIARAAGYSEATLYKHFQDKQDLFLHMLQERLPPLGDVITMASQRAGSGTVRGTLEGIAAAAIAFYAEAFPSAASIISEPRLSAAFRAGLKQRGAGPHVPNTMVAAYLRAEVGLGRLPARTDPEAAASLLLGACFQHAFLGHFDTRPALARSDAEPAARLVATLLAGIGADPDAEDSGDGGTG